jgi:hypothetical protein
LFKELAKVTFCADRLEFTCEVIQNDVPVWLIGSAVVKELDETWETSPAN